MEKSSYFKVKSIQISQLTVSLKPWSTKKISTFPSSIGSPTVKPRSHCWPDQRHLAHTAILSLTSSMHEKLFIDKVRRSFRKESSKLWRICLFAPNWTKNLIGVSACLISTSFELFLQFKSNAFVRLFLHGTRLGLFYQKSAGCFFRWIIPNHTIISPRLCHFFKKVPKNSCST